jgi:D-serine deaminase-like pyridoxal phosphate-dependent protein
VLSRPKAPHIDLGRLLDARVDWRYKSFPAGPAIALREVARQGWSVLGGEFMLPVMVLKDSALRHNNAEMAAYCDRRGISLAPHAKTTMSPQLLKMQFEAGAWGATAASMNQVRVWREFGVDRIVLANELVEPASIRWIANELRRDPDLTFYCLVDSIAGAQLLESTLAGLDSDRPLNVLVELGIAGGRSGSRTREAARAVAQAVAGSRHLALAGVESFEGVIGSDPMGTALETVDGLLAEMRALVLDLDAARLFGHVPEVIVTAGGSAFLDRVADDLGGSWTELSRPVRLVLRSGCYLTHDAGHYRRVSPFGSRIPDTEPLREALEAWGVVLSMPEPGRAVIGFGRRDVPYDLGLPMPRLVSRGGLPPRPFVGEASITGLYDQHALLSLHAGEDLRIGDMVGCGISHPCTAFDKWRLIPVVDDDYRVLDAVLTYF